MEERRGTAPPCMCVCLISYISLPFFFFFISIIHTNDGGSFNLMKGKSNYTLWTLRKCRTIDVYGRVGVLTSNTSVAPCFIRRSRRESQAAHFLFRWGARINAWRLNTEIDLIFLFFTNISLWLWHQVTFCTFFFYIFKIWCTISTAVDHSKVHLFSIRWELSRNLILSRGF